MPAKKDSKKSDNKSYLNKRSKAQLEDIMSQFGSEDLLDAESIKTNGAVTEDTVANMLNNEDEYGLDDFKTDDSLPSASDNGKAADNGFTDFCEKPAPDMVKEDEYGISELAGFDSVKAEKPAKDAVGEDEYGISELAGFDSVKTEEPPAKDIVKASDSDDYSSFSKGFLSDPEPLPQSDPEPTKEEFVFDELSKPNETEDFACRTENIFQEPEQQLGELAAEAAEESCAVIELAEEGQEPQAVIELAEEEHAPTIDISLEDMREQDAEIDYSYDLDSGFRPSKRIDNMKKEKVVKEKTAPQTYENALSESAIPTAGVFSNASESAAAPTAVPAAAEPHPAHRAKLVFSPKTDKINKRFRKKYKIDKDSIFSENDYVDGFILANNETLLRRYDALKVNGGNIGRILITNKRMLFNTSEKAEIPLAAVEGLRSAKYWAISWAKFIFSIILLGIAAFAFVYDFTPLDFFQNKDWLIYIIMGVGGLLALIGFILLFSFARRRFALKIFINSSYEFITYNSKKRKKESAVMESVIFAKPGKELDKMVREIGALIIQSREGFFD